MKESSTTLRALDIEEQRILDAVYSNPPTSQEKFLELASKFCKDSADSTVTFKNGLYKFKFFKKDELSSESKEEAKKENLIVNTEKTF